ncbi:unnamed protein product [Arabis nemorensis]|uniref:Uncharacterized protein n=1 Tax=Arabis nemorensis TaxID=586526 RepID=A0A565BSK5_9BRAS|nr:unnamed protein product [Arabis nemorensis]
MSIFSNPATSEESINDYGWPFWTQPQMIFTADDIADNKGFPRRCRCGGDIEIDFANSTSQRYRRYYKFTLAQVNPTSFANNAKKLCT